MSDTTTTEPAATEPTEAPEATTQGDPVDEPLGEGGKKALQAERERAKALEKQLGEATSRLSEIEKAQLSDLERAQAEATEAKAAAAKASADALRFRIAAKHSITDEDAELFLTGSDEETLVKQAARLVERTPATPTPKPDKTQGGAGGEPHALNSNGLEEALKSKLGIS